MPLEALLQPISSASRGGDDLSGEPDFIQLQQAIHPPSYGRDPDYDAAESLAESLLSTRSKDLQVAVFYVAALQHRLGFAGLKQGLELLHGLVDKYWDDLYPRELDYRRGPLASLTTDEFTIPLQLLRLNDAGHSFWDYRQGSNIPTQEEADNDEKLRARRDGMLADGKIPVEVFNAGVAQTSKAFYKQLAADIAGTLAVIQQLDAVTKERFGKNDAPSYRDLRLAVEAVQTLVKELLAQKLLVDPDPVEATPAEGEAGAGTGESGDRAISATVASAADAESRVIAAAHFLRKANPVSPSAYLLLRALRWGEMRANGASSNEKMLSAPPPDTRSRLRGFYLDQQWEALLESTEGMMATPVGRGWLDLQFYAIRACEELRDREEVRGAILGVLRSLLADVPTLPDMTLMDAMPTASPETKTWIANEVLEAKPMTEENTEGGEATTEPTPPREEPRAQRTSDVYALAQREAAAGKADRAIQLLMRELAREPNERARFLRRTQMATIMVDNGLLDVAKPLLQQLITQIDNHNLAEWEDPALVAQPLALMVRLLDAQEDTESRQEYYLRVCTLNPIQALSLTSR
jgi:type VI secretion system protein ImpA